MSTNDCKFCNRVGLSFLPTRIAYVPGEPVNKPDTLPTFGHMPIALMRDGKYVLRLISEGYVYLLDERAGGTWRCFAATPTGHFRELALDSAPKEQPSFQCAQKGHTEVAALISIPRASEAGKVWVSYSRTWLTAAARKKLKTDTALRAKLMVSIDAKQLVSGGEVPRESGLRVKSGAELATLIGEYAATPNDFTAKDRRYASNTMSPALDRHGQADALVARMHANSPNNAIVLNLPDTIGIVQDINHWRNLKAGDLAKYQGDAAKLRERIVGDIVLDIEASMRKQGQGKTWGERYATKLNMKAVRADRSAHEKKVKELESHILSASDDWDAWTRSAFFSDAWRLYDGDDAQVGAAMERDFTYCVFGSGGTPLEQERWKSWLTTAPEDESNPLWLAFAAGSKDLLGYLTGKLSKGVSLAKNLRKFNTEFATWRKKQAAANALRLAQQESGMLATTMAAQVQALAKTAPDEILLAAQRMRYVIASRVDIEITPVSQKISVQHLVVQLHETVWGPAKTALTQTVTEARSMRVAQSVSGAWLGTQFSATQIVELEVWLPEPAIKLGTQAPPKVFPAAAPVLALPRPALNPWQGLTAYLKGLKATGGTLLGMGAALNMLNLATAIDQLDNALGSTGDKRDEAIEKSIYGVISGSMGVMSVTAEVTAGLLKARVVPSVATTTASRLLAASAWTALGGGALGVITGSMDSYQALKKKYKLLADGDSDAATTYGRFAYSALVGAVASGAIAVVGTGALLAQAGATGVLATAVISAGGVLSAIPIAGWIILAIGALAAGLYFGWKAATQEDTPLEKWLSRCCYRDDAKYQRTTRTKFAALKEEMDAFQQAIYGLTVTLDWHDRMGKDAIELAVTMPGFNAQNSDYAFYLELKGPRTKQWIVDRKSSPFSEDVDLKPQPPAQHFMSATPTGRKFIPLSEVSETVRPIALETAGGAGLLSGELRVNEDYFDSVRLKFEYWPDAVNRPDLKFTPAANGVNFVDKKD